MPKHELRLLSLDGGGVRGLSTLQILKQLMEVIDPESPPKPCDFFDMIGGTITGGYVSGKKCQVYGLLVQSHSDHARSAKDDG